MNKFKVETYNPSYILNAFVFVLSSNSLDLIVQYFMFDKSGWSRGVKYVIVILGTIRAITIYCYIDTGLYTPYTHNSQLTNHQLIATVDPPADHGFTL